MAHGSSPLEALRAASPLEEVHVGRASGITSPRQRRVVHRAMEMTTLPHTGRVPRSPGSHASPPRDAEAPRSSPSCLPPAAEIRLGRDCRAALQHLHGFSLQAPHETGEFSARALTRSGLATKSAIPGDSSGSFIVAMLFDSEGSLNE